MIKVLRLGHRRSRDARISTHCGLVARAFGADGVVYSGEKDEKLLESVSDVSGRWGGTFSAEYAESHRNVIKNFNGVKVHLTMYGEPVQKVVRKIPRKKDVLVIVGGEKVPPEVYQLADFNVAVTSQPHSEIAALAIFLDRFFNGKELDKKFKGAGLRIVPMKSGKKVVAASSK